MNTIFIIKILSIGVTAFYMLRNDEQTSNLIGGLLITSFGLTLFEVGALSTFAVILYNLTLGAALFLVLANRIQNDFQVLFAIFLLGVLINGTQKLLNLPSYGIFYYISIAVTLLYIYFLLKYRNANILVVTTIPIVACLLTLSELVF